MATRRALGLFVQAEGVENRVQRRVFGSGEDEVAAERERPHTEKLYYLWAYSSPNIILVIISSRMR